MIELLSNLFHQYLHTKKYLETKKLQNHMIVKSIHNLLRYE